VAHLTHDFVVTDLEVVDEELVGVDRRPAQLFDLTDGDPGSGAARAAEATPEFMAAGLRALRKVHV
jgi:hypothetical protein